jgi:CP family cyanate transporter-like MFS transporter
VPAARPVPWSTGALLVCIVLAALNLRSSLSVVPPLVGTIAAGLGLSAVAAGLLTALPVACMGLFAPVAQRLAVRIGREGVVLVAVLVLTVGNLLRLGGESVVLLYGGTLATGVGIAAAGTVLPGVVKEFFAARAGSITGVYVLSMGIGGVAASALAAPLATALGSWPRSLAVWALPALVATLAWTPLVLRLGAVRRNAAADTAAEAALLTGATLPVPPTSHLPWRSGTAWLVAAYMAGSSFQFYSQLAWLAPAYEDLGRTPSQTGLLMAAYSVALVVGGLIAPALTDLLRDRRWITLPVCALQALGLLGVLTAAEAAPWLWMIVLGIATGAMFSLGLVMMVDYADSPAASGRIAALAFLVGYSVAAVGPLLGGALRDLTGGFGATFATLLGLVAAQVVVAARLSPRRAKIA